jgi:hypothetical protein
MKIYCCQINCECCNKYSCYVCGGYIDEIDKCEGIAMAGHNKSWAFNEKRCPQYVADFSKVISDFPSDEIEATAFLRDYKIKAFTKRVIDKHGFSKVKETFELFKDKRLLNLLYENYIDFDYGNYKAHDIIDKKIFFKFKI